MIADDSPDDDTIVVYVKTGSPEPDRKGRFQHHQAQRYQVARCIHLPVREDDRRDDDGEKAQELREESVVSRAERTSHPLIVPGTGLSDATSEKPSPTAPGGWAVYPTEVGDKGVAKPAPRASSASLRVLSRALELPGDVKLDLMHEVEVEADGLHLKSRFHSRLLAWDEIASIHLVERRESAPTSKVIASPGVVMLTSVLAALHSGEMIVLRESYSQYHGPDQDLRAWAGELKKLLRASRENRRRSGP